MEWFLHGHILVMRMGSQLFAIHYYQYFSILTFKSSDHAVWQASAGISSAYNPIAVLACSVYKLRLGFEEVVDGVPNH